MKFMMLKLYIFMDLLDVEKQLQLENGVMI